MIDLYTWSTPNGRKVSIMLEECGLAYNTHPVSLPKQEQFKPEFLAISPNNRIPALVDGDISVFESGAILVYLAEKTSQFLPGFEYAKQRAAVMQWLMWQMGGVGPMIGQLSHFFSADNKIEYAINRYLDETLRLCTVMNKQLLDNAYLAGDYSIADMATYPWIQAAWGPISALKPDETSALVGLNRWLEDVSARPAVIKGMAVGEST